MALENAKKLFKEIINNPELKTAFEADPRAALAAGDYGCTYEELKEAIILSRPIDDEELDSISGGYAGHNGGCTGAYYTENCAATVEAGSWCSSNDYCYFLEIHYTSWHSTR